MILSSKLRKLHFILLVIRSVPASPVAEASIHQGLPVREETNAFPEIKSMSVVIFQQLGTVK